MTAAVKTKTAAPKPAAPKAKPATEAKPVETPAPAPIKTDKVNAAYAPEDVRAKITQAFADLDAKGFTRGQLADLMDTTKGAVWRFQTNKIHTVEVPAVMVFIEKVVKGEISAPERKSAKVSATVIQERVEAATAVLNGQSEAKSIKALRDLIAEALAALSA